MMFVIYCMSLEVAGKTDRVNSFEFYFDL
ncbi:hypothetical protein AGR8A_Lc20165 [Agrobacterium fabrum str. J-07]|nr:hypothetical protein AGR8A_Lc20165 [Agrobacterium fabrum str. J-07]